MHKQWRIRIDRNGLSVLSPRDERFAVQLPASYVHCTLAQKIDFASRCCETLNLSEGYTHEHAPSPIQSNSY